MSRLMQQFDNFIRLFSVDRMLLALFLFPKKCPCKIHVKTQYTKRSSPGQILSRLMQCSHLTKFIIKLCIFRWQRTTGPCQPCSWVPLVKCMVENCPAKWRILWCQTPRSRPAKNCRFIVRAHSKSPLSLVGLSVIRLQSCLLEITSGKEGTRKSYTNVTLNHLTADWPSLAKQKPLSR